VILSFLFFSFYSIKSIFLKIIRLGVEFLLTRLCGYQPPATLFYSTPLKDLFGKISSSQANSRIGELISRNSPCMIARFGSSELNALLDFERFTSFSSVDNLLHWSKTGSFPFSKSSFRSLRINAGFFDVDKTSMSNFYQEMMLAIGDVDLLGSWLPGETNFAQMLTGATFCELSDLEPYYHQNPWSMYLKDKTVLLIHPFACTIESQYYNKRDLIFPGTQTLPNFNLVTLTAVQSIAGNSTEFKSWQDALDFMTYKALDINFDIAIIGCGAYGFPLAARLKRLGGKRTIHLGGATQLLFGIKGKRWDEHPYISRLYNENWTREASTLMPPNAHLVEGATYW